jgi:hypothetical protein
MKKFALCIHDLRASDEEKISETISFVRKIFNTGPVTIHLIMDEDVNSEDETFLKLRKEVESGQLEIVFHGIAHSCAPGTGRFLAWYHKNEAEFLSNFFDAKINRVRYNRLKEMLQTDTGFCPPCWISGRDGRKFIKSLYPSYTENLLSITAKKKHLFSLPVSLASCDRNELVFLRLLASLISAAAVVLNHSRLRLVIHTIDLDQKSSVDFFVKKYLLLRSKGFLPVLQRDLIV